MQLGTALLLLLAVQQLPAEQRLALSVPGSGCSSSSST
jgi:hypothetical protein